MPKAGMVTVSWPLAMHYVANGPFVTAYPRSVTLLYALKELPVELPVWSWPVLILTLKDRTLSPVAERFIQSAREVAKAMDIRPPGPKGRPRKLQPT